MGDGQQDLFKSSDRSSICVLLLISKRSDKKKFTTLFSRSKQRWDVVDLLLIVNDVIPSRIQDQGVTPVVSSFSQLGGGCSVMGGTDPFLSLVIGKLMGGK